MKLWPATIFGKTVPTTYTFHPREQAHRVVRDFREALPGAFRLMVRLILVPPLLAAAVILGLVWLLLRPLARAES